MRLSNVFVAASLLISWPLVVLADSVQLQNGDVLHGQVLSLDAKQLMLKSETLGEIKLPREKIAAIQLGDKPLAAKPALEAAPAAAPAKAAAAGTPDDVVKQLQASGLDPGMMKMLEQAFPIFGSSPEAKQYFNERVEGLISGEIDIGAVRKDAEKVVEELEGLKKDLGPQSGPALDPYLSILKRFLRETAPGGAAKDPAAPKKPKLEEDLRKLEKELKSGPT